MTCSTSKKIGTIEFRLDTHHSRPHSWCRRARPPSKAPRMENRGFLRGALPASTGGSRGGIAAGLL